VEFDAALDLEYQVWCTLRMAAEKNRNKDVILWIVTVLLVGLAIFWYMKPH
jgi:hypothetical protein